MDDELCLVFDLEYLGLTIREQVETINHATMNYKTRAILPIEAEYSEQEFNRLRLIRPGFSTLIVHEMAFWIVQNTLFFRNLLCAIYDSGYKLRVISEYGREEDVEIEFHDDDMLFYLYRDVSKWLWIPEPNINNIPEEERTQPPE